MSEIGSVLGGMLVMLAAQLTVILIVGWLMAAMVRRAAVLWERIIAHRTRRL